MLKTIPQANQKVRYLGGETDERAEFELEVGKTYEIDHVVENLFALMMLDVEQAAAFEVEGGYWTIDESVFDCYELVY